MKTIDAQYTKTDQDCAEAGGVAENIGSQGMRV
jgi:hypothetical protein